jgi:putative ABC transport system permease protein
LRCVGADASQLARSVLREAGLTGRVSSAGGFGVGCALGQGALALAPRFGLSTDLPARIAVSPTTWAVPLLAGLVVTLAAGLAPARLATRVPPVAALSPLPPTDPRRPGGRGRLIWSILLSGLGAALLAGALVASRTTPSQASVGRYYGPLLAGLTGAALILTGLLIGACFWLPRLVAGLGAVLERTGPGARLAVANVRNNPARTTATATALLVGVALVAAMSTGAASLKRSVNDLLDQELPYDLALGATSHDFVRLEPDQPTEPNPATALPADLLRRVEDLDSLTATLSAPGAELDLAGPDGTARLIALGVDLERADQVLRSLEPLRGLDSDSLLLSPWVADQMGWSQGQELTVSGTDGAAVPLRLEVGSSSDLALALVTSDRLAQLAPQAATQQLWGRLAVGADPVALVDDVQRLIDDTANFSAVAALRGTAIERASYERVLDTIAAVAIGLLAVAVLIALIGVANTLSLAVIERRRESALLRALGLTRGQARWMLTVEGVFMAAVAALSGLIVGVALAWAGVGILLGTARGRTLLAVDPVQLGLTGLGAVLAGGLASLLPGASVARTAPAQALTTGQV